MKIFSKLSSLALLALTAGATLTSCQNDFDMPPIPEPKATMEANTTIAELKAKYWQDDANYYQTLLFRTPPAHLLSPSTRLASTTPTVWGRSWS